MEPGTFIWACTDSRYWPGVVIAAKDAGLNPPPDVLVHVYWFADNRISLVPITKTAPFASQFNRHYGLRCKKTLGQRFKAAVLEAIIEYSGLDEKIAYDDAISYATKMYRDMSHTSRKTVPEKVRVQLQKRLSKRWTHYNTIKKSHILKQYLSERKSIAELCVACYTEPTVCEHPYFQGKVCKDCKKKLRFTVNASVKCTYCDICGNDSNVSPCNDSECTKSFCGQCIKNFLGLPRPPKWLCFICNPEQTNVIRLRKNYTKTVIEFIAPNVTFKEFPKYKIGMSNIMILFHGRSEVLPILCPSDEKLSIISSDNELRGYAVVKRMTFPFSKAYFINYSIGYHSWICDTDQSYITSWKLSKIEAIDYLIGGTSYINIEMEESAENYQTKQFWEFMRIFYISKQRNMRMNTPLKFIYEMNPAIKKSFVDVVTRYLNVTPYCIQLSGDEYRLIWTNIEKILG